MKNIIQTTITSKTSTRHHSPFLLRYHFNSISYDRFRHSAKLFGYASAK
ncbi:MAG: hypothetical protein NTY88_10510 [Bacteroidetes bacterium]|nr:hypothetical protein [Bacteroidota bacterium]